MNYDLRLLSIVAVLCGSPTAGIAAIVEGDVLVTAYDALIKIDPATGTQELIYELPLGEPGSFEDVEVADGRVFVLDEGFDYLDVRGRILEINRATGAPSVVSDSELFFSPVGMEVAPNGDIYVAQPGQILRWSVATGTVSPVSSFGNLVLPADLLWLDGSLLVLDHVNSGLGGKMIRVNPSTGEQQLVASMVLPEPGPCANYLPDLQDLTLSHDGGVIVVGAGCISRFDIASAQFLQIHSPQTLGIATGIVEDAAGEILISDTNAGAVFRLAAGGSSLTTLSAGIFLASPSDVALVAAPEPDGAQIAAALLLLGCARHRWRQNQRVQAL